MVVSVKEQHAGADGYIGQHRHQRQRGTHDRQGLPQRRFLAVFEGKKADDKHRQKDKIGIEGEMELDPAKQKHGAKHGAAHEA